MKSVNIRWFAGSSTGSLDRAKVLRLSLSESTMGKKWLVHDRPLLTEKISANVMGKKKKFIDPNSC